LTNTPLSALRALSLDTETTGLDVKTARIIEIGLAGHGQQKTWSSLVRPDVPIPARSTTIHGIDDAMVENAPRFGSVWQEAFALIDGQVVIGHSLGFDLAILKRECDRAKVSWQEPIWLDTRFLAILLDARLPDFSIGALSAWLDLPPMATHRALADAQATSAVFSAMIPHLREKGIHTVGEALTACRRIQTMSLELSQAGWAESPPMQALAPGKHDRDSARATEFDVYPYQNRIARVMSAAPVFIAPSETINTAIQQMEQRKISSLFVGMNDDAAETIGIITERDILRALAKEGSQALTNHVSTIASHPLVTVRDGAYVYRAIGTMARAGIRHLGVVGDDDNKVIGALSQRDLLRLRAQSSLVLGNEVDAAASVADLGLAWAKLPAMAKSLLKEGISATDIAGIIARELGALTRRAAMLAERAMIEAGKGSAPCRYAVMVLGSAGRGESLLAMDQDNALVFADGAPGSLEDQWFAAFGALFANTLDEVGVPLCKGGVMAREPSFRGSITTWVERMDMWLGRSNPEDILSVDIVFDARTVLGDPRLFHTLLDKFRSAASENPAFLKRMIESHPDAVPSISLFGNLKADSDGRLDLKRNVISRVVAAARVLAIRYRQPLSSTIDRLAALQGLAIGSLGNLDEIKQAYQRSQDLILRSQLTDIAGGRKPDSRIMVSALNPMEKAKLKGDLSKVSDLGNVVRSTVF
jgi:CBS domain-containing protein